MEHFINRGIPTDFDSGSVGLDLDEYSISPSDFHGLNKLAKNGTIALESPED